LLHLTIDSPESVVKANHIGSQTLGTRYHKTRRFNPIWKRYKMHHCHYTIKDW
jgi:hypothetical protein